MLLAGVLAAAGLLAVSAVARVRGYRLGGTITVGLLAVYTLRSLAALPVFVVSTVLAYYALAALRDRTLIHGRDEFVATLAVGTLPSLAVIGVGAVLPGLLPASLTTSLFLGSVLPGLAAYNVASTDPAYRRRDVVWALGLYAGLVAAGVALVAPVTARLVGDVPTVLFASTADVAALRDAAVASGAANRVATRPAVLAVLATAVALSEAVRRRLGLRLGVVSLGLIAVYTLVSRWYLPLFLLLTGLAFAVITAVHRRRFVYGRALLSLACAIGVLASAAVATAYPMRGGLAGLMVGLLAGVTAYNVHVTPRIERRQLVPTAVATYAVLLVVARAAITPTAAGLPQGFGVGHVAGVLALVAACLAVAARYHVRTRDELVLAATSVLRGGDG